MLETVAITLQGVRCNRCGYAWVPRDLNKRPTVCAKCKSPYWDRARRFPRKDSAA